jgi:hypothetical protein
MTRRDYGGGINASRGVPDPKGHESTRVLLPGTTVRVEVLGTLRHPKAQNRSIGDAV